MVKFDQLWYSITDINFHFQSLDKELQILQKFLTENHVKVRSAIDIGCGDGYITNKLKDILGLDEIYGVDLNKRLLDKAAKRNIHTILGDMDKMTLDKKFDIAISYGSLHHSRDAAYMVSLLKKASNKYIIIVDSTIRKTWIHKMTGSSYFPIEASPYPIRTKEEIIEALTKSNCNIQASKTNKNANIWHDRSLILATH